jgi:hypothetical protein
MVCWHNRYSLGDEQPKMDASDWFIDFVRTNCKVSDAIYNEEKELTNEEAWTILKQEYIFLPLYLYNHSGISISTRSFIGRAQHAEWDSGQVGWIYISKKDAVKEWGKKLFTKIVEEKAVKYLQGEVKNYDNYLTGNVYGYIVENADGEQVDSCWEFYPDWDDKIGYENCLSEARDSADFYAEKAEKEQDALDQRVAIACAHGD